MKNKVKIEQLALLLVIPGGKLLSLPSKLASQAGHDSWLVMLVMLGVDAVCLTFLLWAFKLNTRNLSLDDILKNSIGKVFSKIVLAVLLVLMLSRILVISNACYKLFDVTFSVQTNWIGFVLPTLVACFFAVHIGFKSIARVNELLFGLILIAFVSLMVMPTVNMDFGELRPIAEDGFGSILRVCAGNNFWFADYLFLYFVMDELQLKKHPEKPLKRRVFLPMLSAFLLGTFLNVATNAVFVSIYGNVANFADLAMSKISMFSVSTSTSGRWDWLSVSMWVLSVLVRICVYVYSSYRCLQYIIGKPKEKFDFVSAGCITAFMMLPLFVSVGDFEDVFISAMKVPFAVVQYLLPLSLPLLVRLANAKTPKITNLDAKTRENGVFCDQNTQNGTSQSVSTRLQKMPILSAKCQNRRFNGGK